MILRRLAVSTALLATLLTSCAATLSLSGKAPTQLDDGATCATSILSPATSLQIIHARVSGAAKEDSVAAMPGAPFAFSFQLPAGSYSVTLWASIALRPQLVGCDTTVTREAPAKPHRPRID